MESTTERTHMLHQPSDPAGPTGRLSNWIYNLSLRDVPDHVKERAKYLLLDGVACLLVGAHLPGSSIAVNAILDIEAPGTSTICGWDGKKISPLQAALLNSAFIQGFELDDWHSEAPLHSNSLIIPAVLAAAEHDRSSALSSNGIHTGAEVLLASIVGFEVGPRVGLGLHGTHMLTMGWHSGAVFGPSTAAAASAKLLRISPEQIEDALGIACTQAGGLMSAQYGSEVKRMQHGFAARNGLMGTFLARSGYTGIKRVYEHQYGGFLSCFSLGNDIEPRFMPEEIAKGLSSTWKLEGVCIKPYSAMALTHCTVDCIRDLQTQHPTQLSDFSRIRQITIEMGEAPFHHGGWQATRPLTPTGAQMSSAYVGATQIVDRCVLPPQFRDDMLNRDEVWAIVTKTKCVMNTEFKHEFTRVTIELDSDTTSKPEKLIAERPGARGVSPPLSNAEILEKWRLLTRNVIDEGRRDKIEKLILHLEHCQDIDELIRVLTPRTNNPLA